MYMDVDCFLTKDHLTLTLLEWPWNITHFIRSENCVGCGCVNSDKLPEHFKLQRKNIPFLIQLKFFWCQFCDFAAYDHFTHEECQFCSNLQNPSHNTVDTYN